MQRIQRSFVLFLFRLLLYTRFYKGLRAQTTADSATTSHPPTTSDLATYEEDFNPGPVRVVVTQFYRNSRHVAALGCNFTTTSDALYTVEWYVNGERISLKTKMSFDVAANYQLASDTDNRFALYAFSLDSNFTCDVTVFNNTGAEVWGTTRSTIWQPFQVEGPPLNLTLAAEHPIRLIMNIPFGCDSGQPSCSLLIKLYDPNDTYDGYRNSIAVRSTTGGIPMVSGVTDRTLDMSVTSSTVTILVSSIHKFYNSLRSSFALKIKLAVVGSADSMWNTEFLKSIEVTVRDTGYWRRKMCKAFVDPHMRTFEGRWYENQNVGEFVLFRSTRYPIEIQMVTKSCGLWSTATCPCALTFRSGDDVFTMDHCNGHTTRYLSSKEGSLRVYQMYSTYYIIYFPTGMLAHVYLIPNQHYFMDVMIQPSVYDFHYSEGLCGNLNGNRSDEFQLRDSSKIITDYSLSNPPDDFSVSWDLTNNSYSSESLRLESTYKNVERWNETRIRCVFPYESPGQSGSALCSINEVNLKLFDVYLEKGGRIVQPSTKNKRNVQDGHFEKRIELFWPSRSLFGREKRTAIYYDEAWTICRTELEANCSAYALKDDVTGLADINKTLSNCALDVMLDGSTTWVLAHCNSFSQTLVVEIAIDEEFRQNNPAITTFIQENSCPNNCNEKGRCVNGTCHCNKNYATDLCLVDITLPPSIQNLHDDNICDETGGKSCDVILIVGDGFVEDAVCRISVFEHGYCFIDGICYNIHSANPSRSCEICIPSKDVFDWQSFCKDAEKKTRSTLSSIVLVAVSISGAVLSFVVAFAVVRLCCFCSKRSNVSPFPGETHTEGEAPNDVWTADNPVRTFASSNNATFDSDDIGKGIGDQEMKPLKQYHPSLFLDQPSNTKFKL